MLHVQLSTPGDPIDLDLVKAHSFVPGSTSGTLPPLAAPIVAQLPQTGGPLSGDGDTSYNWYIAFAGLTIFLAAAVAMTFPRPRRTSHNSDR